MGYKFSDINMGCGPKKRIVLFFYEIYNQGETRKTIQ